MGRLRNLLRHTLPAHLWRRSQYHYFQRRVLPNLTNTELEGIKLDLGELSLKMREVILNGGYERPETTLCRKVLQPGERILELGGAIGYVGLYCIRNLGAAEVVSAEPNPKTAAILRRNYQLNGLRPQLEEVAIGPREELITFHVSSDFWTDNLISTTSEETGLAITVPALPLKRLIERSNRTFSALIVDIEGGESSINWSDLPVSITKIIIELHPSAIGYARTYHVLNTIINLGFMVESRIEEVVALRRIS